MTILDDMLPPAGDEQPSKLDELIAIAAQRIIMMDIEELAAAGAHEYDEEAVAPAFGSNGHRFLREVARCYITWIHRERRFPAERDVPELVAGAWHRDGASGSEVAQAYVDLGLFYSAHRDVAQGAEIGDFRRVLDEVGYNIAVTLTDDYGPLV